MQALLTASLAVMAGVVAWFTPAGMLGVFSAVFPFDFPVMEKDPVTVHAAELILAGLVAGVGAVILSRGEAVSRVSRGALTFLALLAVVAGASAVGALDRCAVAKQFLRWAQFWLALAVAAQLVRSMSDFDRLGRWVLAGAAILSAWVFIEVGASLPNLQRAVGPMATNATPPYAALGILFFLSLGKRPGWTGAVAVSLVLVSLLTQSRTGNLAVLAGLGVWAGLSGPRARRRFAAGLLAVLVLVGAGAAAYRPVRVRLLTFLHPMRTTDMQWRMDYFRIGSRMVREHPMAGIGAGNYGAELARMGGAHPDVKPMSDEQRRAFRAHLHNFFLQVAAETGLLGLAAWLAGLGWIMRRCWAARRSSPGLSAMGLALGAVFLVSNMLDHTMIHSRGVLYAIGWGAVLGAAGGRVARRGSRN